MSMRYRIGEFSKLGKVSVKTLRYYDEEGILRPGYVDGFNRYRYYLPEQITTLCTILRCRRAGLSIEEIKTLLSGACRYCAGAERRQNRRRIPRREGWPFWTS